MERRTCRRVAAWLAIALLSAWPLGDCRADAPPLRGLTSPGLQCRQAIAAAERANHLPPHLLAAIGRIESGRRDPESGALNPWPWSINVEGTDHVYDTKPEVIAAVRSFQAAGSRSIDIGCMQINLLHHPDAFASLEDGFDPQVNANYAAKFLTQLFNQTGSWEKATAWYHSATPGIGEDYQRKVAAALPEEERIANGLSGLLSTPPPSTITAGLALLPGGAGGLRMPPGGGFAMPPHGRIIPLAGSGMMAMVGPGAIGRGLDSYRSFPVAMAARR